MAKRKDEAVVKKSNDGASKTGAKGKAGKKTAAPAEVVAPEVEAAPAKKKAGRKKAEVAEVAAPEVAPEPVAKKKAGGRKKAAAEVAAPEVAPEPVAKKKAGGRKKAAAAEVAAPEPTPEPVAKKKAGGRKKAAAAEVAAPEPAPEPKKKAGGRKKAAAAAEVAAPEPAPEPKKKAGGRKKAAAAEVAAPEPAPEPKKKAGGRKKAAPAEVAAPEPAPEPKKKAGGRKKAAVAEAAAPEPAPAKKKAGGRKKAAAAEAAAPEPAPAPAKKTKKAGKPAKKAGKPRKGKSTEPTLASRLDKHDLYQRSVQSPEADLEFFVERYKELRGREPKVLREDFCGTAFISATWAGSGKGRRAIGVDLDTATLQWAREHNVAPLPKDAQKRVELRQANVLDGGGTRADVTCAMNFSYCVFKTRAELRHYLEVAYQQLADDGMFVTELYGGTEAIVAVQDEREIAGDETTGGDFTYQWEQAAYNPITHETLCHIHFQLSDGSKIERAFTYDWRLWSIAELRELLYEVGFQSVRVYWEATDDDGDGTGEYYATEEEENQESWLVYLVAAK